MCKGLEARDCLVLLRSGGIDAGEAEKRAQRALGSGGGGTRCLLLQMWPSLGHGMGRCAGPGLWSSDTGASLPLALTFLVTVLHLFLLLLAGLLLLLLLE